MLFPLLLHPIFFKYQKAYETTEGSRMKFFRPVRQKVFEKSVILRPMHQKILCQILFESRKVPLPIFSVLWDTKNFSTELWCHDPPPAPSMHDNFRHQKFFEMQMCCPTRLIVSVKRSSTVNGENLLWCIKISIPEFFWNTERLNGYTTKFIGTMRHKKIRKNPWCSPALVIEKIFDTRYFWNQRKALIRFSTALWDEKLSTENRDAVLPFPPSKILFPYQKASETTKGSRMKFFSAVRQIFFGKTCDIPSYASKFYVSDFFFEMQKGSPTSFLGVMRHKKIIDRTVMSPPFPPGLPMHDNFRHQKFFEIQICSPTRFLVSVKKKFNGEWWNPLLMHKIVYTGNFPKNRTVTLRISSALRVTKKSKKHVMLPRPAMREIFRYVKFHESEKGSHTNFYFTMRRKTFDQKSWHPHIMHEIYLIPEKFWNNEVFSNVFFTTVRQKFLTEPWCPPPLHENFGTRYFFETQNGSLTIFLGTVKQKQVDRKSWCRSPFSSSHNFISIPKSFWNNEGIQNEVFQSCGTKIFRKRRDTPTYASKISVSDFFLKAEKFPYQFSRCYETQRNFRQKCDVTTPTRALLCMTIFDNRSFLKCRCVPLRDLSLVGKNSSTVNDEILFWCIKFSISEIFWNTERFHYEFYRY